MMKINFMKEELAQELANQFNNAINFEEQDMICQKLSDDISRQEKRLENKDGSLSEVKLSAIREDIEGSKKLLAEAQEKKAQAESDHVLVMANMTAKDENNFGNSADVVRTVLRVVAATKNQKLTKYALMQAFEGAELYQALEAIHVTCDRDDDGASSADLKAEYQKASQAIETVLKTTFSLPFETAYTKKFRVKLNKEDKGLLHECYVKGFSDKYKEDKGGEITFDSRQVNTLVKVKTNRKTGEKTYDYSALSTTIANIVRKKYFLAD